MIDKFRFSLWDDIKLSNLLTEARIKIENFDNITVDQLHKVKPRRFNLGFGIFGIPEQCKDGKYCHYEDLEKLDNYWQKIELNETINFYTYKKELSKYIESKDLKILVLFSILSCSLIANLVLLCLR